MTQELEKPKNSDKFQVHLDNFDGPFDLLLSLIGKHKLDITHLAISQVTDEFIIYVRNLKDFSENLDEISDFLVIAATLLDIKAARLLPGGADLEFEDLELLESRDLLFAKLLQYKAFKDVALAFGEKIEQNFGRYPRSAKLEPNFAALMPELRFDMDARMLALLAAGVFSAESQRAGGVGVSHLHLLNVSVAEQGILMMRKLAKKSDKTLSFQALTKDAKHPIIVIGRFLALLELYKMNAVTFVQKAPLGELMVKFVADDFEEVGKQIKETHEFD